MLDLNESLERSARAGLLLLLVLGTATAHAQSPFLQVYYGQDTLYLHNDAHLVMEAANGDVVHLGHLGEQGNDTDMVVFRRLDPDGALLAHTRILTTTSFPGLDMYSGQELPDGSFLFFGADSPYMALLHVDAQGNLISVRRRNSNAGYYQASLWENDSTIMALGFDYVSPGPRRLLVSRFDAEGQHIGSLGYLIDSHGATGIKGVRCASGGILIAAEGADTVGMAIANAGRTCLLRLDEEGNALWARRYVRPGQMFYPNGLVESDDGTVLLAGTTFTIGGQVRTYTLHVDALGDTLATRAFQLTSLPTTNVNTRGFAATSDSTALITGFLSSDGYIISCDRTGAPLLAAQYLSTPAIDSPVRSSNGDMLFAVMGWPPGGYQAGAALGVWRAADPFALDCTLPLGIQSSNPQLVLGEGFSQQPVALVFEDFTPQCTQVENVMSAYDPCIFMHAEAPQRPMADVRAWPVPATDVLSVGAPNMERIEIVDTSGRTLLSRSMRSANTIDLDISFLAPGTYDLRITMSGGAHMRRIVKM